MSPVHQTLGLTELGQRQAAVLTTREDETQKPLVIEEANLMPRDIQHLSDNLNYPDFQQEDGHNLLINTNLRSGDLASFEDDSDDAHTGRYEVVNQLQVIDA